MAGRDDATVVEFCDIADRTPCQVEVALRTPIACAQSPADPQEATGSDHPHRHRRHQGQVPHGGRGRRRRAGAARRGPTRRCSGYSYEMFFDTDVADDDLADRQGGVKVVVDPSSALLLDGATLDYKDGLQGAGFAINNPNAQRSCGCGQSLQLTTTTGAAGRKARISSARCAAGAVTTIASVTLAANSVTAVCSTASGRGQAEPVPALHPLLTEPLGEVCRRSDGRRSSTRRGIRSLLRVRPAHDGVHVGGVGIRTGEAMPGRFCRAELLLRLLRPLSAHHWLRQSPRSGATARRRRRAAGRRCAPSPLSRSIQSSTRQITSAAGVRATAAPPRTRTSARPRCDGYADRPEGAQPERTASIAAQEEIVGRAEQGVVGRQRLIVGDVARLLGRGRLVARTRFHGSGRSRELGGEPRAPEQLRCDTPLPRAPSASCRSPSAPVAWARARAAIRSASSD